MSGKIRHLENICENISLRNRGKVIQKSVTDRQTHRLTDGQGHLEKALLALKILDQPTGKILFLKVSSRIK